MEHLEYLNRHGSSQMILDYVANKYYEKSGVKRFYTTDECENHLLKMLNDGDIGSKSLLRMMFGLDNRSQVLLNAVEKIIESESNAHSKLVKS